MSKRNPPKKKHSNTKSINKKFRLIKKSTTDGEKEIEITPTVEPILNIKEKIAQKYAVLYPCIISFILLCCELVGRYNASEKTTFIKVLDFYDLPLPQINFDLYLRVFESAVSYFAPTIITSALWVITQQEVLKIPAGLNEDKALHFNIISLVYLIIFVGFLILNKPRPEFLLIYVGITIGFIIYFWFSLKKDVRSAGNKASGDFK